MTSEFSGISQEEYKQLQDAIVLITVLIAGADGDIDAKEKSWAEKVTEIRSYTLPDGIKEFYLELGQNFEERLGRAIDQYAGSVAERNEQISAELSKLNDVFPKLENREVAATMYKSLLTFAEHVAKASGGFLSWGRINPAEKRLLGLDMIHPVEDVSYEEDPETDD